MTVRTHVTTDGESFRINGRPTSEGHVSQGCEIEALLLNARMVQGIFDDRHPTTQQYWSYPDTERWDSERNTREFIAAMAAWWQQGLVAFTLNLQGDNPRGYSDAQPWYNSAFGADGSLFPQGGKDHGSRDARSGCDLAYPLTVDRR